MGSVQFIEGSKCRGMLCWSWDTHLCPWTPVLLVLRLSDSDWNSHHQLHTPPQFSGFSLGLNYTTDSWISSLQTADCGWPFWASITTWANNSPYIYILVVLFPWRTLIMKAHSDLLKVTLTENSLATIPLMLLTSWCNTQKPDLTFMSLHKLLPM